MLEFLLQPLTFDVFTNFCCIFSFCCNLDFCCILIAFVVFMISRCIQKPLLCSEASTEFLSFRRIEEFLPYSSWDLLTGCFSLAVLAGKCTYKCKSARAGLVG